MKQALNAVLDSIKPGQEFEVLIKYGTDKGNHVKVIQSIKEIAKRFPVKASSVLDVTVASVPVNLRCSIEGLDNVNKFSGLTDAELITSCVEKERILHRCNDNLGIKYRLSSEKVVVVPHNIRYMQPIMFRFKNRVRYVLLDSDHVSVSVDITMIRESRTDVASLRNIEPSLEVEFEYFQKSREPQPQVVDLYLQETGKFLRKLFSDRDFVYDSDDVMPLYLKRLRCRKLVTMNPISIDKDAYNNEIFHRYAVTDKIDGEHVQIILSDACMYSVNSRMEVTCLGVCWSLGDSLGVLHAEMVGPRYLVYDAIFFKGRNISNHSLCGRLSYVNQYISLINDGNDFKCNPGHSVSSLEDDLGAYYAYLERNVSCIEKKYIVTDPKILKSTTYEVARIVFEKAKANAPYANDGIIFIPLDQEFDSFKPRLKTYKWKPIEMNTIDFYVKFSACECSCYHHDIHVQLYCQGNNDDIVLFETILVDDLGDNNDGMIRSMDGAVVLPETVVEASYTNNSWHLLRSRPDKTEYVKKFKTKHGNHITTARNIMRTIKDPVELVDPPYYQRITNIGRDLRSFHNKIKNQLVQDYCRGKRILDVGFGRGGDIHKYQEAKPDIVVALDADASIVHGDAAIRYSKLRERHALDTFPLVLIHHDFTKSVTNKANKNPLYRQHLLSTEAVYDVIAFFFSLHYLWAAKHRDMLVQNIHRKLGAGGRVIITVFDGDTVSKVLHKKKHHELVLDNGDVLLKMKKISSSRISVWNAMYNNDDCFYDEHIVFKQDLVESMQKVGLRLESWSNFGDQLASAYDNCDNKEAYTALTSMYGYYVFKR